MNRLPATPLFIQTLGLVIATLLAAQVAALVVILSLPTPQPEIYTVSDVAAAIRHAGAPATPEGRALTIRVENHPPGGGTEGRRRLEFRAALAAALGVDPARLVVAQPGLRILAFKGGSSPPIRSEQPLLFGGFLVGMERADGRWTIIRPAGVIGLDPWRQRVLLALVLAVLAVSPLAWLFARRLAAPMAAFAAGAERLGRDPRAAPLDIAGSPEVASAVRSFNVMQERLARYVEDRTAMVGAIAHDLRTPLTRLRFRIEAAPEALRGELAADIEEMDQMISATLAFVRGAARPSPHGPVDLASVVETVIDEAALTGARTFVERAERVVVDGDTLGLKRLFANLVNNAVSFGREATAKVFADEGMAVVEIDDAGPGMPETEMETAFEPFRRLEASRSRNTGGIGLGLAVVRAIARAHGGEVTLSNRPAGGLRARVTLPLAL
ncbi:MAG TPA: ATP-binding protein [Caulobacteraceae bacterium]